MNIARIITGSLIVAAIGLGACSSSPIKPSTINLKASLSGAAEVPPNNGTGTGALQASLNPESNVLTWTVTYTGLTGPVSAAHFHGPAMPGQNAGVVVPFSGDTASPMKGKATLTAAQVADLLTGKWYVNVHTAAYPGGEIRGQVMTGM